MWGALQPILYQSLIGMPPFIDGARETMLYVT